MFSYHSNNSSSLKTLKTFIEHVTIVNIDEKVKKKTIQLRKDCKLKLPDCIIAASSSAYKLPLLTADKGFKKVNDLDLILYANN